MAQYEKYAITAQRLTGIADAIREKKKTTDLLTPEQMVTEIRGIESGSPSAAEVTFGYVKKTETVTEKAPEGKRFYNGVLLPEIPADYAEYTYIMILEYSDDDSSSLYLYASNVKPYYQIQSSVERLELPGGRTRSILYAEDGVWGTPNVSTNTTWCNLTTTWAVIWSNYDIPNGSATATEIYFKGSEALTELTETVTKLVPVERGSEYAVTSANLNDIAKRTQEMAGTTKLMTLEDIIYVLNRVKFVSQGTATSEFTLGFEAGAR